MGFTKLKNESFTYKLNFFFNIMENTATKPAQTDAPKFPEQVTGMYILAESLKRL